MPGSRETALTLLYKMMKSLRNTHAQEKAEQVWDEAPLETLLAYRHDALKDAIVQAAKEDPGSRIPLVLADPKTFLGIAPELDKMPSAQFKALRAIREGREMKKVPPYLSSEGIPYSQNLRQELEPGYNSLQRLWFDGRDPYAFRVEGHEGRHRSQEMVRSGVPKALFQLEDNRSNHPLSWRAELNEMLKNDSLPVYSQHNKETGRLPRNLGPNAALWRLLGITGASAAAVGGTDESVQ